MKPFLIVGQGIAGTMLHYFLEKAGAEVYVCDAEYPFASSRVAAGVMNPVTGRNFVKTWLADTIFPFAKETYLDLEKKLNIPIYQDKIILRQLPDIAAENDWIIRSAQPDLAGWTLTTPNDPKIKETLIGFDKIAALNGGRCDMILLVETYKKYLIDSGKYVPLDTLDEALEKKNYNIVFCDGSWGKSNPYFNHVPLAPNKGEVLIVEIKDYPLDDYLVKDEFYIASLGNEQYWVGSQYVNKFADASPTPEIGLLIENSLKSMLKIPFKVLEHRASVRPTVRDRKPILGRHPEFSHIHIFNGMGTKGATLAPHFATVMRDFLLSEKPLSKDIGIR